MKDIALEAVKFFATLFILLLIPPIALVFFYIDLWIVHLIGLS